MFRGGVTPPPPVTPTSTACEQILSAELSNRPFLPPPLHPLRSCPPSSPPRSSHSYYLFQHAGRGTPGTPGSDHILLLLRALLWDHLTQAGLKPHRVCLWYFPDISLTPLLTQLQPVSPKASTESRPVWLHCSKRKGRWGATYFQDRPTGFAHA